MSEAKNDGGSALPHDELKIDGKHVAASRGLSARDYFAGQALTGLLACSTTSGDAAKFAAEAYQYADAMLKARERT